MKRPVGLLLLCPLLVMPVLNAENVSPQLLFVEDFESDELTDWQWFGAEAAEWRVVDGRLELVTPPSGMHTDDGALESVLARELPTGDGPFCVDVVVFNRPEGLYENAGLMLYVDRDNYVRVNKESFVGYRDPPVAMQVVSELGGQFHDAERKLTIARDEPVELRMWIAPETVTGFFRRPGDKKWTEIGSTPRPVEGTMMVGVSTSYGVPGSGRAAGFDDFRLSSECSR